MHQSLPPIKKSLRHIFHNTNHNDKIIPKISYKMEFVLICFRYNKNLGEDPESVISSPLSIRDIAMSPPLVSSEAKPSNTMPVSPPRRIAVSVQGAWKQYGSGKKGTPVLQNLNMTVPEGTM
jgi:hypothetical protein